VYADPIGYVIIPKISLYKSLEFIPNAGTEEDYFFDLSALNYGAGVLEKLAKAPDNKIILVGHTPGGFDDLETLVVGDEIILLLNDQSYDFYIYDMFVTSSSNGSVLWFPTDEPELVLITCKENKRMVIKAQ
jgi:LPXTG-site transpeptidase (sortase) family protein